MRHLSCAGAIRRISLLILVALSVTGPTDAQVPTIHAPERVFDGQAVVLHVEWDGNRAFDGALLAIPGAWQMESATVVDGYSVAIPLSTRPLDGAPGRTSLLTDRRIDCPCTLRIRVRTRGISANSRWTLIPYRREFDFGDYRLVPEDDRRTARTMSVQQPPPEGSNRVLHLDGRSPGPVLDGQRIPDLGYSASYTLETWFRTTKAGAVLASTWSGNDAFPYAAEWMIDETGRLAFFQGQAGHHRSMRTASVVADGTWHHVSVIHDPARGWTRLLLDGIPADSLYGFGELRIPTPATLALGGRPGGNGPRFEGDIDEFRIWGVAREVATVRAGLRVPLPQPAAGATILGFETPIDRDLLATRVGRFDRRASDLVFRHPLQNLTVRFDGVGVTLGWVGSDPSVDRYIIERSADGQLFEPVGTVYRTSGLPDLSGNGRVFRFTDLTIASAVAYYRIRQAFEASEDRLSHSVKVGVGETVPRWSVVLEGNFPNPFSIVTTVRYRVESAADVTVSVWDLSGHQVRMLASGPHEPGDYSAGFTAGDLPSGTYFVRLQTNEGVQSRQMMLAR